MTKDAFLCEIAHLRNSSEMDILLFFEQTDFLCNKNAYIATLYEIRLMA
jgi:hypothetical protein